MAKQSKGGVFSIADLNKEMNKNSKFGALLSEGGGTSKITEYIHTGNYILNACMSGSLLKGVPNNRSVCLSGESGVGKTYLLLNMCREAQKMGYFVIFYDSENAVDDTLASNFGIDLDMMRYEPVQTIQEFRSNVTNILDKLIEEKSDGNEIPKLFIALDSAGNLASQKEIDDAKAYTDKADMSRAKMMKSVFRIMMSKLGIIGGTFVFTNHTYKTLDLYSQDIQSGGCLIPGSKVLMSDGLYKNIEDIRVGDEVMTLCGNKEILKTWEFEKNTYTIEFEDGSVITCSEDHRFYVGGETDDVNDDSNWVYARDLINGDIVKQFIFNE
jgi:RecA/RadA recombinase